MSKAKADFLRQIRARWTQASEATEPQAKREIEDIRFYNGVGQWDADLVKARGTQTVNSSNGGQLLIPARPCLTINRTREPVRQVLNQERNSEFNPTLVAADDWGDTTGPVNHTEIELREGIIRRIQRDSEAMSARSWAFERATIAGRGFWLVNTRYVPGKTWSQEIYLHRIHNQASVLLDPGHEEPDGSDALWGFIGTDLPIERYKAEYGQRNGKHNRISGPLTADEWRALGDAAPGWFSGVKNDDDTRYVRVVDYYYTEYVSRELALLADGSPAWQDELSEGTPTKDTRTVITKKIKWCKIDGCDDDVLDETDWPGHYLPIIKVVGEELQPTDGERRAEGIVRPMEDGCRGWNYLVSKFVERVGLTPIAPYMMAAGQDETFEDEWNLINTRVVSRVHYKQVDDEGRPAPPPTRNDARAEVADLSAGLQIFNEAIVSTSRVPETALGHVDPTVKSGKLANALIQQAEQGSSNYLDNLKRSIRHEGRVINDLLYPIYGQPGRLLRMMDPSGKLSQVVIGKAQMPSQEPGGRPQVVPDGTPGAQSFALTPDAEFNVAVSVARGGETRRQELFRILTTLIGESPEQTAIIGDLPWKYSDAPDHEELERRYKAVLAPPVQAAINGQAPSNPQDQAHIAQLTQALQEASKLADKNKTDLIKTQMQEQGESQRQMADIQERQLEAQIRAVSAESIAQAKVDAENFRSYVDASEQRLAKILGLHMERITQALQHSHEARTQMQDHAHEAGMAAMGHSHTLEQGQQAADLMPPPATNGQPGE